jgi:hypothetical protein
MKKMTRVMVWADSETPLGSGNLVGDVPLVEAYEAIYKTADVDALLEKFCFNTLAMASKFGIDLPPLGMIPEMSKKLVGKFNLSVTPKIVLDTGEVVYGCQVWWREVNV